MKWRDLNFCVVCNECYEMHVCIAWMFVERIYGSTLLCYVHSIDDFFYLWLGQNLDCWGWCDYIDSVLKLGRCWSWDTMLQFTQPLVESPSHVCWAQSQMGSAAELHLALTIIMIEREGGPPLASCSACNGM